MCNLLLFGNFWYICLLCSWILLIILYWFTYIWFFFHGLRFLSRFEAREALSWLMFSCWFVCEMNEGADLFEGKDYLQIFMDLLILPLVVVDIRGFCGREMECLLFFWKKICKLLTCYFTLIF